MPSSPQRIVIVGAGPCGLLLALSLLERSRKTEGREQYQVSLFERRPDPRSVAPSSRRTYPISLQARGQKAIRSIPGLLETMEKSGGSWTVGLVMHKGRGKWGRLVDRKDPMLMMDRNSIVASMLDHLEGSSREYGGGGFEVSLRFECPFEAFESDNKSIRVSPADGDSYSVPYDRLIVADGSGSSARAALVAGKKMTCEENYVPDSYRTLYMPMAEAPGPNEARQPHHLAPDRVHSFMMSNGVRMLLVPTPESDGDGFLRYLHGVIIFAPDGGDPIAECADAGAVMDYFRSECPHTVGRLITEEEAEALRCRAPSRVLTVRCDRLALGTDVILLGDAAHAVPPGMGQGCNSALQDVLALCLELDAGDGDWDVAVPAYAEKRLPEAHAVKDLSDYSVPRTRIMWMEFFFRMTVGRWIRRWFPSLLAPMPLEIIMEGDTPYTEVLRMTKGWVDRVKRSMLQGKK